MTVEKTVRLITGLALFGMALVAMRVDIGNNYDYAVTWSNEAAYIAVISALSIVLIPTAATAIGWNKLLQATFIVTMGITVFCAHQAYNVRQDAKLLHAQDSQETHETAKTDAAAARATLASIKETGTVDELSKLASKAGEDVKAKCATRRKDGCTQAKDNEARMLERVSQAKARDKAQTKVDAVKVGESTRFTGDNIERDRNLAYALTLVIILTTQLVASLGGQGARLISGALKIEQKKTQQQVLDDWKKDPRKTVRKPRAKKAVPAASNVTQLRPAQH